MSNVIYIETTWCFIKWSERRIASPSMFGCLERLFLDIHRAIVYVCHFIRRIERCEISKILIDVKLRMKYLGSVLGWGEIIMSILIDYIVCAYHTVNFFIQYKIQANISCYYKYTNEYFSCLFFTFTTIR